MMEDIVYSKKIKAGKKRTYFIDAKKAKNDDYYLVITESIRRLDSDKYQKHKIFLYKEDFNRFLAGLEDVMNYFKHDLLPDFDYEMYDNREDQFYDANGSKPSFKSESSSLGEATDHAEPKIDLDETNPDISEEDISW